MPEGKRVVNTVINGGAPPITLKDNSFIQGLQKASIYFRWFACSMLLDDYKELEDREDKDFPKKEDPGKWYCYLSWKEIIAAAT